MARRRAIVFMDTNSLMRLAYAVATARYKGETRPLRLLLESGRLQVLVTNYIVGEAREKFEKLLTRRALADWDIEPQEVLRRLNAELDNMIQAGQVVPIDASATPYTRIRRAVEARPSRQTLLKHRDWLRLCVRNEACRKNIEKDLPVVDGILLAYDVAAAIPASSRAGVTMPPFPVVTDDRDLFCSLYKCLRRKGLNKYIILIRYDTFRKLLHTWTAKEAGIGDEEMYAWCLSRHCSSTKPASSLS